MKKVASERGMFSPDTPESTDCCLENGDKRLFVTANKEGFRRPFLFFAFCGEFLFAENFR